MYHVQQEESWKTASKECRSEFIEQMRDCEYGASSTLDAWQWFAAGWQAAKGVQVKKP
jgi:hypothetical protein